MLDLKHRPLLAQKLEELGAALGVLGRWGWAQGLVLPGNKAAKKAEQCRSGSKQPFISSKREMDLSAFGFAFDPNRAGTDESGNLAAVCGQLSESANPPECVRGANRNFLQH